MNSPDNGLVSHRGRWILPMAGGVVTQIRVDYAFGIVVETYDDRKASTSIRINVPFEFEHDSQAITIDPERPGELAPLLVLHKAIVSECYAVKDGHLFLRFANNDEIRVAPQDQYEAWEATGHLPPIERQFSLLCLPSGGLALH